MIFVYILLKPTFALSSTQKSKQKCAAAGGYISTATISPCTQAAVRVQLEEGQLSSDPHQLEAAPGIAAREWGWVVWRSGGHIDAASSCPTLTQFLAAQSQHGHRQNQIPPAPQARSSGPACWIQPLNFMLPTPDVESSI